MEVEGAVVWVQCHHHVAAGQVSQQFLTVGTNCDGPDQDPVAVGLEGGGAVSQNGDQVNQVLLFLF